MEISHADFQSFRPIHLMIILHLSHIHIITTEYLFLSVLCTKSTTSKYWSSPPPPKSISSSLEELFSQGLQELIQLWSLHAYLLLYSSCPNLIEKLGVGMLLFKVVVVVEIWRSGSWSWIYSKTVLLFFITLQDSFQREREWERVVWIQRCTFTA